MSKIHLTKSGDTLKASKSLQQTLQNLSDGSYIISIDKLSPKRSISQNSWLHWVCDYLEHNSDIGYTAEEWKDFFKSGLLMEKRRHPVDRRKKYLVQKGTSQLKTDEFTIFMEKILLFCETELKIPRDRIIPYY